MSRIVRRETRAHNADGSPLGGPGPTPRCAEPAAIYVACPGCGADQALNALALARKLWNSFPKGEGETAIARSLKHEYDAIDTAGWDVRCGACGVEFRILYGLEEWGKMSNAFFPTVSALLVRGK